MIYGIGTDICDIRRIQASLERHGERFARRVLSDTELPVWQARTARWPERGVRYLATRFSAKEAFSKAVGLGMHMPMAWSRCEIANLPSWVIGLIAAGGLAAALSTAAGLLLAISSAISHDLIKKTLKPNISEKGELMAARVSMTVAIIVATWLGINPPGFAAQVVALAFGIAGASIFPALMMGIFSKRINSTGATAGMLAGLISTCVYIFLYLGWFFIPGTNTFENVEANWLLGISPLSFGAVGAMINFTVAFIVSSAGKAPPQNIQDLVESVRYPRGAGQAVDH